MSKGLTKRQKAKVKKFAMANWKVLLALFLIVAILFAVAYYLGWIDIIINRFRKDNEPMSQAGGHVTTVDELDDLRVTFLDIGQGDCIIIELPDNKNMIIDSGDDNDDQKVISNFAEANNIDSFDYVLLTHQDLDHVANMNWIIDNYDVGYIFRPNNYSDHELSKDLPESFNPEVDVKGAYVSDTKAYADFMVSAYNEGCIVEIVNKSSDFSNKIIYEDRELTYSFEFFTPTAEKSQVAYSDPNNYSPIFMLEYAGKRVMFNGDAEEKALKEYVETYGNEYNVDVYKVGHHGSRNATSVDYLNAIDPEYAVIQCGEGNDYGHPHPETIKMLYEHGDIEVYRNDTNKTMTLSISEDGEMNWVFGNSDMSNNYTSGDGETLEEILGSVRKAVQDYLEENIRILNECVLYRYREI